VLGAMFTLNSNCMGMLRMSRDTANASQVLQQRVEQLRIANWQRISDPAWLRDYVLNTDADGSWDLNSLTETITFAPFNSSSTAVNRFTRSGGVATAANTNVSLLGEESLKVTCTVTWNGVPNSRQHTRQAVAILGKGGVAK